jgi:hypothetical protein
MSKINERNKFLTVAIGLKMHNSYEDYPDTEKRLIAPVDFRTWHGFGQLFEWAVQQKWWLEFVDVSSDDWRKLSVELIHPDRFADAVYNYLKYAEGRDEA